MGRRRSIGYDDTPPVTATAPAVDTTIDVPQLQTAGTPYVPGLGALGGESPPAEDPPRTRRRRRTRAQMAADAAQPVEPKYVPTQQDIEALGSALGEGFDIVSRVFAAKRGDHWRLQDEEKQRIGLLWGAALAPFMGRSDKWVPFALATLATVGVVLPRIEKDNADAAALTRDNGGVAHALPVVVEG